MAQKILFSNIGYARGIDGTLRKHLTGFGRNLYCAPPVQQQALNQLKAIIDLERPDLCCLVEIDQGSIHSGYYNQLHALIDQTYKFHDVADKYGENSLLGRMPLYRGKSNAFLSATEMPFQRLYFRRGAKRLLYRISLPRDITLFFGHFSLQRHVRMLQLRELNQLVRESPGEVIVLADFNIMYGFSELQPLLLDTELRVINREDEHTFVFYRRKLALDLCICSPGLAGRIAVRVIPQPYSDHAALLVSVED